MTIRTMSLAFLVLAAAVGSTLAACGGVASSSSITGNYSPTAVAATNVITLKSV